jgi:hypothetical protein
MIFIRDNTFITNALLQGNEGFLDFLLYNWKKRFTSQMPSQEGPGALR